MKKLLVLSLVLLLGVTCFAKTNYFDDMYIGGDVEVVGTTTFGAISVVGNLTVDGTLVALDGSTSVRNISAGFTSLEAAANRIGVSTTIYMSIATTAVSGITTITHTGNAPAVVWTASGGFDLVGAIDLDAVTTSGIISVDDVTDTSSAVTGSIHTDGGIGIAKKAWVGTDLAVDGTSNLDDTDIDGTLDVDGTTALIDGATSVRNVSAGFTSAESPANRLGLNATEYMQIATTITSGITAITHTGNAPTVTWTANSFSLVGSLDVSSFFDMGTMDAGIAVTTANPFAMEVHTEPLTTLTAGATGYTAGIRSRYHVSVAQPNAISIAAVEARLRVKHALADGVQSAVSGVIEASGTDADFTGTATTQRAAGFFALDFDEHVTLADDGWLTGVTINSSVNGSVDMSATKFAGLRISTNAGSEVWEQGIIIDSGAATTDIQLQDGSTITDSSGVSIASTGDVGAVVGSTCTAAEYGVNGIHKTVLTIDTLGNIALEDKDDGNGIKIYDFPAGYIQITGATCNLVVTSDAAITTSYVMALGSTVGTDGTATLTGTQADTIISTTVTCTGGDEDFHGAPLDTVSNIDGTSTEMDLYINAAVADGNISGAANVTAASGTITIYWINLGDY